jgi:hypothetical protein
MDIVATAPPQDAESVLLGCVVCGYTENTDTRIFSCNCHLPIHDVCIPEWREKGGTCPFCEQEWLVATPMPTPFRRQRDNCQNVVCCAFVIIGCIISGAFAISMYFFFQRI